MKLSSVFLSIILMDSVHGGYSSVKKVRRMISTFIYISHSVYFVQDKEDDVGPMIEDILVEGSKGIPQSFLANKRHVSPKGHNEDPRQNNV